MNTDFRIAVGCTSNPKVIKLMRRCGDRAFFCLVSLWGWAAQYRPEGDLTGMDDESIEIAAGWTDEEGEFVAHLSSIGFLDGGPGCYRLHDWEEHNPWVAGAPARSEAASKAGKASAKKRSAKEKKDSKNINDKSSCCNGSSTDAQRRSNANPTPSPSPSPTYPPPAPACVREADLDDPIPPPSKADQRSFTMTADWQPSEAFTTLAETSGITLPDDLAPALQEFRAYWLTQERKATAREWDLALVKAVKNGFSRPAKQKEADPIRAMYAGMIQPRTVRDLQYVQGEMVARAINEERRRKAGQHSGYYCGSAGNLQLGACSL